MATEFHQDHPAVRSIAMSILFGAAIYLTASYSLTFPRMASGISTFWLPNGLALAALLRTPTRQWPVLVVAATIGNLAAGYNAQSTELGGALSRALVSALQYSACAYILRRRFGAYFDVLEPVQLVWLGAVGMLTTVIKVGMQLILPGKFHLATGLDQADIVSWIITNFLGLFVLALPVLAISSRSAVASSKFDQIGLGALALLIGALVIIFGPFAFPGIYVLMPVLMFLAWRHGLFGAGIGTLTTVFIASLLGHIGGGLQDKLILVGYSTGQIGAFMELFFTITILTNLPIAVARARQQATDAALANALAAAESRAARLAESEAGARASEAALVTAENRWRTALEGSGLGVWDWYRPTDTVYYSRVWKAIRGFEEEDVANRRAGWEDGIHPDDLAAMLEAIHEHIEGRRPFYEHEHRVRCKDGSFKWVFDRGMVVERDEGGTPLRMIGTNTDIDMLKQASLVGERHRRLYIALAECNAALARRGTIEALFGSICEILVTSGKMRLAWIGVVEAGSGLFRPVGAYSADEGFGHSITATVSAQMDDPSDRGVMGRAYCEDGPVWIDDFVRDERALSQSGQAIDLGWYGAAALPLRRKGKPFAVLSMYTDEIGFFDESARALLSDMASQFSLAIDTLDAEESARQFQDSLAMSERRFRAMFETAPIGIALMDTADGDFLTVNPMFETIVGWTSEQLLQKTWQEITHPDDLSADRELAEQFIAGHTTGYQLEKRYVRGDGTAVWVHMTITRFSLPGTEAAQHLCMIEDITERRELERQVHFAQRMDAIGQLTGGVAHDFNNLLTIVIGSSETLIEQLTNPQQQKLAELILQAAEHGGELTRQLLAFARRQPLAPKPFDVTELLGSMAPLITRTLGANLEFSIENAEAGMPAFADPTQTEAAILNLCINARDAMPDGGRLTIATGRFSLSEDQAWHHGEASPGDYIEIRVSDTGAGISPDLRNRVFEPFFTTKEPGRGTGLGLSMVYGFVQQSRGWLDLQSTPGKGSTFTLYLPAADTEAIALPGDDSALIERGSENVLIVEDNDMVREHARGQFESLGYRVTAASNGAEALEILERDPDIDLLFTDIIMPGDLNGRQLGEKAIARWPSLRVLYTSGYSEDTRSDDGRLLDDVTLLAKPYSKRELSALARKVLDEVP